LTLGAKLKDQSAYFALELLIALFLSIFSTSSICLLVSFCPSSMFLTNNQTLYFQVLFSLTEFEDYNANSAINFFFCAK